MYLSKKDESIYNLKNLKKKPHHSSVGLVYSICARVAVGVGFALRRVGGFEYFQIILVKGSLASQL